MSSARGSGRRVPPKGRALRSNTFADFDDAPAPVGEAAEQPGAEARAGTRAANRAAKRAASGVRPKAGGRAGGGRAGRRSNNGLIGLGIAAAVIVVAVLAIGNPFGTPVPTVGPTAALIVGDGTCPTAQPAPLTAGQTRIVTISTSKGDIVLKIEGGLSPIAAGNFVALATCRFYDGSVFHRTAALGDGTPFVIQGGRAKEGTGSIRYVIQDEPVATKYKRGTVAMARTDAPNSQTSQFFIVLDDKAEPPLASANTYAIFGEVISGMDVADAIFAASGGAETPSNPVVMTSVTVSAAPAPTATATPTTAPTAAPTAAPTSEPTTAPASPAASTNP